jgi:RNA recognition motif-containing protein
MVPDGLPGAEKDLSSPWAETGLECEETMTKTLYVGNLPWAVTESDLLRAFSEYASVSSARVVLDRETGRSRGFGFVELDSEQARSVIEALNDAEWGGRRITVNEAQPRPDRRSPRR